MVAILVILGGCAQRPIQPPEIPLSEVIAMSQNNEIEKIVVEDEELLITATDGSELRAFKEPNTSIFDIEGLNLEGVVVEEKGSTGFNWGGLLMNFLPLLIFSGLLLLILGGLLFFIFRRSERFRR